jgi:hypothetical protein
VPLAAGEPAWATCTSSSIPGVKFQVVAVKSLVWPGAFVVYSAGAFSNCYVGYGFKNAPFVPAPPPAVMVEYEGILQAGCESTLNPKPSTTHRDHRKEIPCGAARNPPESTRIRSSTESVRIRKRHPSLEREVV